MDTIEREALIREFAEAPANVETALIAFPRSMWNYRPSPESWCIHEILIHLLDCEAQLYIRFRTVVAECGGTIVNFDEGKWADKLDYLSQDCDQGILLFNMLRQWNHSLLTRLDESDWSKYAMHTVRGRLTLEDLLVSYVRHVKSHIGQMTRIHESWLAQSS